PAGLFCVLVCVVGRFLAIVWLGWGRSGAVLRRSCVCWRRLRLSAAAWLLGCARLWAGVGPVDVLGCCRGCAGDVGVGGRWCGWGWGGGSGCGGWGGLMCVVVVGGELVSWAWVGGVVGWGGVFVVASRCGWCWAVGVSWLFDERVLGCLSLNGLWVVVCAFTWACWYIGGSGAVW